MRRNMIGLAGIFLLIAATIPAAAVYRVGDTVDDHLLLDLGWKQGSLGDHAGQIILLNFWTNT